MTNESTIEKMKHMRLHGMASAFHSLIRDGVSLSADEMVAHLVDRQWEDRYNKKLTRLIQAARFRTSASMEQIDFSLQRKIDKNMILRFSDGLWIKQKYNILMTGKTGVGKSFIACALGHSACMMGFKVLYFYAPKLFSKLKLCKADGSYMKELSAIQKNDLLIIDDFGLEHLDTQNRLTLLEIIEDRNGKKSTIITSQLPVKNWHEIIGDQTIADAICDRIIHGAHRVDFDGPSVRGKFQKRLTEEGEGV